MDRQVAWGTVSVGLALGLALGVWAGLGGPGLTTVRSQILVVWTLAVLIILVGLQRSWSIQHRIDLLHPLVAPLGYIALSFLAPLWVTLVAGDPVRALSRETPISVNTAALLGLGVLGYTAGAWCNFSPSRRERASLGPEFASTLLLVGRCLVLVPLSIAIRDNLAGGVAIRGLGQLEYTPSDSLHALLGIASLAAVVTILAGQAVKGSTKLLAPLDWVLIVSMILAIGARGSRSDAVAIMLVLVVAKLSRRGRLRSLAAGIPVVFAFIVTVLHYRNDQLGRTTDEAPVTILLGDMSIAAFTTGATAARVPSSFDYAYGDTLLAGLVRQLPSPISVPLLGPPTDHGAYRFRQIVGYSNPDGGLGFSIPADGYLNFGAAGVAILCALIGLLASWSYPRMDFASGSPIGIIYPVLLAIMPFGLRSDFLGFNKNILYPVLIVGLAMIIARSSGRKMLGPYRHRRSERDTELVDVD